MATVPSSTSAGLSWTSAVASLAVLTGCLTTEHWPWGLHLGGMCTLYGRDGAFAGQQWAPASAHCGGGGLRLMLGLSRRVWP